MSDKDQNAGYTRTVLHQTPLFEIVSCQWSEGVSSPMHTHGWSQCYMLVQSGVFENKTNTFFKTELSICETGQTLFIPSGSQHEMKCLSKTGKTLHIYTPQLTDQSEIRNFKPITSEQIKKTINLQLTDESSKWSDVIQDLERIQKNSVSTQSPFFMNQLFSGVLPEVILAEQYTAQMRTTLATYEASPALTLVEMEVVKKLGELIGWQKTEGLSVPGGSAANFMALHCARQRRFSEVKQKGWPDSVKARVFVSAEAHYSLKKACVTLGFGTDSLVSVQTNARGEMQVEDLQRQIEKAISENTIPLMVCATLGTTVLGAFDPIEAIAEICQKHKIWLHVDGAWGGPALFSKKLKPFTKGIEKADSMTFDAHKLLGANLTCSYFLTNDPQILLQANDVSGADYLFHASDEVIDRGRLSWQCGRQADSLSFWTIWKNNGTQKIGEFVDRLLNLRDETVVWIKTDKRFKLISEPNYLNICIQVLPPSGVAAGEQKNWSKYVREQMRLNNQAMVNYSQLADGTTFLRLILAHPDLSFATIQTILNHALEIQ